MKKRKIVNKIIALIILVILLVVINLWFVKDETIVIQSRDILQIDTSKVILQDINYTESLSTLRNPDRGFYYPAVVFGTQTGFDYSQVQNVINEIKTTNRTLIHLRIDISKLSGRANGNKDKDLSEKDKSDINDAFNLIRQNKLKAIVRISYDFDGIAYREPYTLDAILQHIEQFKPIFEMNQDVITVVENGFLGLWGEMHCSSYDNINDLNTIIKAVLSVVPSNITVNVRTLDMYTNLFGDSPIDKSIAYSGCDQSRVGFFNDGYLGNEFDLGTYHNREKAIIFLESHAKYTLFGGEIVAPSNQYNDIENVQEEMFRTHTTYLNYLWNPEITQIKWNNTIYNGNNSAYRGQTAQKYIEDHLGYRFVLKESKISSDVKKNNMVFVIASIENTGFGNVVNEKEFQLLLKNGKKHYLVDTNIDIRDWNSNQISNISVAFTVPDNMKTGEWEVYAKIADKYNEQYIIQFANEGIWNNSIGANYIGKFNIVN